MRRILLVPAAVAAGVALYGGALTLGTSAPRDGSLPEGSIVVDRVADTPSGAVAIGHQIDKTSGDPAVFQADPGGQWHAATPLSATGIAVDVAVARDAVTVVGAAHHGPAVWMASPEGASRLVFESPAPAPADRSVASVGTFGAVVPFRNGLVAVGHRQTASGPVPVAALSTSGEWRWAEVIARGTHARMFDLVVAGDRLVAVGSVNDAGSSGAMAWYSDDGATWQPVDVPAPSRDSHARSVAMRAVAAGPSGLVAVGHQGPFPVVWTSHDGATWELVDEPLPGSRGGQQVLDVGTTEQGRFVVAGVTTHLGDRQTGLAWTSGDGRTWQPVARLESPERAGGFRSVTTVDGRLALVGAQRSGGRVVPDLVPVD